MLELSGTYNKAKVFTDKVDETAIQQIIDLCNQSFVKESKIRIMPDTHAGAGCTIGTTMTIQDKIVPNLVGVDIGCGMEVAIFDKNKDDINFDQLDTIIRQFVPSGFRIRGTKHDYATQIDYSNIKAPITQNRAELSIGTLGGGNHFIELNELNDKQVALVIHSGSRNLGKEIATYYQQKAYEELMDNTAQIESLIRQLKEEGRHTEIQDVLSGMKRPTIRKEFAYLQNDSFTHYMHDMKIAQTFAALNRKAMIQEITQHIGWNIVDHFTTIHNYIDMETNILRKGAISAQKNERVIIPINMRDGSIIAYGKGNADWNYSAPHGAGRLMSRSQAKKDVSFEQFKQSMKDVWSTSVSESTLDESPMAYKSLEDIVDNVQDTIDIAYVMKPLYNFKATDS